MASVLKSRIEKIFVETIFKLTDELIEMYPDTKEFKILRQKLVAASLMPGLVVMTFKKAAEPYNKYIAEKDENFFLSLDLKGTPIEEFSHLKNIYSTASEKTKDSLWKYVNVLTKLSSKY